MIEALYLHVPFCKKRCSYCDFDTTACSEAAVMDAYVDALCLAVRRAARAGLLGSVKTIYLGGGTPSYLGHKRLNSLIYMISVSVNLENVEEFTLEANPDSVDERLVKDLFALGVDRYSLGVQSFDDKVLHGYGRIHTARQAEEAIEAIQTRAQNISVDLICGGPGQDMSSWEQSVQRAVDLGAKHVSVYPLTLEEGTEMTCAVELGDVNVASEDIQAEMMVRAGELLERAGMSRYEVASYAYPGFESKHNSAYWTGVEYLGLGAGASSMLSAKTFAQCRDVGLFSCEQEPDLEQAHRVRVKSAFDIDSFSTSMGKPSAELEFLSKHEAILEDLMLGMRLTQGVSEEQVKRADAVIAGTQEVFDRLCDDGLVQLSGSRYAPTEQGWLMGNVVFSEIWSLSGSVT